MFVPKPDNKSLPMNMENLKKGMEEIDVLFKKQNVEYFFTGSVSFICYGIFHRKVGDFDIIISENNDNVLNSDEFSPLGSWDDRSAMLLQSQSDEGKYHKIDVFKFPQIEFDKIKYIVMDNGIKIADPIYSIKAKEKMIPYYMELFISKHNDEAYGKLLKHLEDVSIYRKWQRRDLPF